MDFDANVRKLYQTILKRGHVCIDVGAHAGIHTFPMADCVGETGRVYAYEPIPEMFRRLRESAASQESTRTVIVVEPYAIGAEDGTTEFVLAVDNLAYSGLRERTYDTPTSLQKIAVEVRRLDTLHQATKNIRYIKIDTEGGEWGVIEGAKELVRLHRPVISFEFGESSYLQYGIDPLEVHRFLSDIGYVVADILGVVLTAEAFAQSSRDQRVWDYAAFPLEERTLVSILQA